VTLDPAVRDNRVGRFSTSPGEQPGNQLWKKPLTKDPLNRGFVIRNLKPYKSLRKFASPKGLRKLRGMDFQRFENMAARAVLQDAGVKRRKLDTKINGFGQPALQRARSKLSQGYDRRFLGQEGPDVKSIQNTRTRQAAKEIINVRRNRAITRTNPYKGKGYDIMRGHRKLPSAKPVGVQAT
jgi:hypothetical protein